MLGLYDLSNLLFEVFENLWTLIDSFGVVLYCVPYVTKKKKPKNLCVYDYPNDLILLHIIYDIHYLKLNDDSKPSI